MRGKLVVGNWKMNGGLASNARLLDRLASEWQPSEGRSLAVCVPFPYLGQAQAALASTRIAWGAQDVSAHAAGAFTGDVAAGMLVEFGCRYALAGHSARTLRRLCWRTSRYGRSARDVQQRLRRRRKCTQFCAPR